MQSVTLEKRVDGSFMPVTQHDKDAVRRIKIGDAITVKFSRPRNYNFHKKYFALISFAFDVWEPEEGPEKNFERFRKEITMLSGYYHTVPSVKGGVRYEADSISFASMDEDTFTQVYEKTISALLKWVLRNYTREDIDRVMNEIALYA